MDKQRFKDFRDGLKIFADYDIDVRGENEEGFAACLSVEVQGKGVDDADNYALKALDWRVAWDMTGGQKECWYFVTDQEEDDE